MQTAPTVLKIKEQRKRQSSPQIPVSGVKRPQRTCSQKKREAEGRRIERKKSEQQQNQKWSQNGRNIAGEKGGKNS